MRTIDDEHKPSLISLPTTNFSNSVIITLARTSCSEESNEEAVFVHEPLINFFNVLFLMFVLTRFSSYILCKIRLIDLFKGTFVNNEVTSNKKAITFIGKLSWY